MSHKLEAKNIIQEFYKMIQRQFNVDIKKFITNNTKDLCNIELSHFLSKGVLHETSCVYSPQHNGVVEQKIGHIMEKKRALILQSQAPKELWGEAILIATQLINIPTSSSIKFERPLGLMNSFFLMYF